MATSKKDSGIRIARVHRVRRRLSDGTLKVHFYHRPTKAKLPAPYEPAFDAAYEAAERSLAEMIKQTSVVPDQPEQALAKESEPKGLDTTDISSFSETTIGTTYLTPEEVCRRWRDQIMPETLANWRSLQIGPPYSKFGRSVLYRADLLNRWERKYLFICDPIKIIAENDRGGES